MSTNTLNVLLFIIKTTEAATCKVLHATFKWVPWRVLRPVSTLKNRLFWRRYEMNEQLSPWYYMSNE